MGLISFWTTVGRLSGNAGATQYDMTVLAPSPSSGGEAYGVYHARVVGTGFHGAVIWPTPTTYTNLNPAGYDSSTASAIYGNQVVGKAIPSSDHQQHAVIWTGSAASLVDLSGPGGIGYAAGTDGVQQVGAVSGSVGGFAGLWSGTASSFVNLNPPGYQQSYATGVYGGIQVGYGSAGTGGTQALVWHGTPESFTVLGPGQAMGISRGQVVGLWDGITRPGSLQDAAIWTRGTVGTFVDVAPSGTTASELFSTNGTQQVGHVSLLGANTGSLPLDHHPAVWTGTAASYQLLPLPAGDNFGFAFSIDGDGNIAGYAGMQNGAVTGGAVPVLWTPRRLAGDANFDGKVSFSDLTILAAHYGKPGEWVDGDFNGDGIVDFSDLVTLASNYGKSGSAAEFSSVQAPEPSGIGMMCLAVAGLGRRRRG